MICGPVLQPFTGRIMKWNFHHCYVAVRNYTNKIMVEMSQYSLKYQQLLRDLKSTVEGLLVTQVANVWSIYGGLNRLHNTMEKNI
ncbi:hypothetical protein NQ314_007597 [Rhamnusium bicolor]|uniref:Uncharacterized protein n=1 Tax=Rhamnusium bicolor TaxID=1586634 RepID=A0AAV8YLQ1_9CUCU|nr:hypothetical protein NQ314_007597 [Rhamnusium bicolor]